MRLLPAVSLAALTVVSAAAEPRWRVGAASPLGGPSVGDGLGRMLSLNRGAMAIYADDHWALGPAEPALASRGEMALAYDPVRDRVVLFGGREGSGYQNDTWEFDGTGFWRASPPLSPGPRQSASMAHHPAYGVVLFGGSDGAVMGDAWSYDGSNWTVLASGPPARYGASMAYDELRGNVVLFGGVGASGGLGDTWLFDGAWTQLAGIPSPPARWWGGDPMTFHPPFGTVVLMGGALGTWFFDGASWTAGPTGPSAFDYVGAGTGERVFMHGGSRQTPWLTAANEMWELDAAGWRVIPDELPWRRVAPSLGFAGGNVVRFGGCSPAFICVPDRSTWIYDGTVWRQVLPATSPPARYGSAVAYDAGRDRLVLFGGWGGSLLDDTWEFDGSRWLAGPGAPAGFVGRWLAAMGYDPVRRVVVLFGGSVGTSYLGDVWEYDGTAWRAGVSPPPAVGARMLALLSFDEPRGSMLLHGGSQYGTPWLTDTWLYDGASWAMDAGPAPSLAWGTVMDYDSVAGATVLIGRGAQGGTEVWRYGPAGWSLDSASPSEIAAPETGAWDPLRRRFVVHESWRGTTFELGQVPDTLVAGRGLGPSSPNRVRAFTATGRSAPQDFLPYAAGHWGVNVGAAHIASGSFDRFLTGPGPGASLGPQLRGFTRTGAAMAGVNLYTYGTLKYGLHVGSGDLDGGGIDEMATAPGPGAVFGPHVRGFAFDGTATRPLAIVSFYAYGTLKYGAHVAGGDVDADGFGELLTGPGPGPTFAPHVRGFDVDGGVARPMGKLSFVAFGSAAYGAVVAAGDVDGTVAAEIVAAQGPGASYSGRVRGFAVVAGAPSPLPGFDTLTHPWDFGANIATVDLDGAGPRELVAAPGPSPAAPADVRGFAYTGTLWPVLAFEAFPGAAYGATVAGGGLGH